MISNGACTSLDIQTQVNNCGERGLLGLALDPSFSSNGYVYLLYVQESGGNSADCGPKFSRLTRVTADPGNPDQVLAGSEVALIDGISVHIPGHAVGTLRFAPDGKLFVSPGVSGPFPSSLELRAQDLNSYNGKILRLNPDGSAPSGNPFYDGTNSVRSKVYAYGLRNPTDLLCIPVVTRSSLTLDNQTGKKSTAAGAPISVGLVTRGGSPQSVYQASFVQCQQLPASAVTAPLERHRHAVGDRMVWLVHGGRAELAVLGLAVCQLYANREHATHEWQLFFDDFRQCASG